MNRIALIGIDPGKHSFHVHYQDKKGRVLQRKKFTRTQLFEFLAGCSTATVVMEAYAGAHFIARCIADSGHEAKLISPQFVRPFINSNKMISLMLKRYVKQHPDLLCVLSSPELKLNRQCGLCTRPESHLSEIK